MDVLLWFRVLGPNQASFKQCMGMDCYLEVNFPFSFFFLLIVIWNRIWWYFTLNFFLLLPTNFEIK